MLRGPVRALWILAGLAACTAAPALAQQAAAPANPAAITVEAPYTTGDAWIDRQLADIDAYARRYPASFLDELERHLAVRRRYAEEVLAAQGWRAGDLYFACAWAQAARLSCRELVRAYSRSPVRDWQAALKTLPVPPANANYRQVRHAIVASYDRWDRPIELDARLREQLGDRDQRLERARQAAQPAPQPAPQLKPESAPKPPPKPAPKH